MREAGFRRGRAQSAGPELGGARPSPNGFVMEQAAAVSREIILSPGLHRGSPCQSTRCTGTESTVASTSVPSSKGSGRAGRERARRGLGETHWDVSASAAKPFGWPVFLRPREHRKSQPRLPGGSRLPQHPLWPGRAKLGRRRGGHGSRHGGGARRRETQRLPPTPSSGFARGGESRLSWARGMAGMGGRPPAVTCPRIGQAQRHGKRPRQLGWEPAGKPETLPAVPSFHRDVPLSPLVPSRPPSSDVPRAVTQLSVTPAGLVTAPWDWHPLAGR